MSQYTTGEMAKRCGVTTRTLQYYDKCGLLHPHSLSEGGRRLYSDEDLDRMQQICFLKSLGLSLDAIGDVLRSPESDEVLLLLLDEQEREIDRELTLCKERKERIAILRETVAASGKITVKNQRDIDRIMDKKNAWKKLRIRVLAWGIPLGLCEIGLVIYWILSGNWRLCVWLLAAILVVGTVGGTLFTRGYYRLVSYVCPHCRKLFKPRLREFFFAGHTPKTRKLRCPACGVKSFCVETLDSENKKDAQA